MKKLINVIIGIVLLISIGFNIYFCLEIKKVTKIENDLIEEIANLDIELEESKEVLKNKESEIANLTTQISSKEEEIKGITETLENLESEKEEIAKQLGELKEATKQETNKKETQTNKGNTDNNGKANNGEQSSTSGGTGNSQTSGAPGGNANVPDEPSGGMSPEEVAAKFGATYYGSGLGGSSGADLGNGGHGIIFE